MLSFHFLRSLVICDILSALSLDYYWLPVCSMRTLFSKNECTATDNRNSLSISFNNGFRRVWSPRFLFSFNCRSYQIDATNQRINIFSQMHLKYSIEWFSLSTVTMATKLQFRLWTEITSGVATYFYLFAVENRHHFWYRSIVDASIEQIPL